MITLGIDPGLDGAFALLSDRLEIHDMPTLTKAVGTKKRRMVDPVGVSALVDWFALFNVNAAILEEVGGRPQQNAAAAFVFGVGYGYIYMALRKASIPIVTVPPATWKKAMNVRGKTNGTSEEIILRADEVFPDYSLQWRGPKGGFLDGRAEAALLAKYGKIRK